MVIIKKKRIFIVERSTRHHHGPKTILALAVASINHASRKISQHHTEVHETQHPWRQDIPILLHHGRADPPAASGLWLSEGHVAHTRIIPHDPSCVPRAYVCMRVRTIRISSNTAAVAFNCLRRAV